MISAVYLKILVHSVCGLASCVGVLVSLIYLLISQSHNILPGTAYKEFDSYQTIMDRSNIISHNPSYDI